MIHDFDITIIGGGLAGLTQSILLARQGWSVACIDRDNPQQQISTDIRTTAISWGSRNLLMNADIWADMRDKATCISDILILDEDSPVELEFNATDIAAEGFGWIVDNRDLRATLLDHMGAYDNITHITGQSVTDFKPHPTHMETVIADGRTLSSRLVIGADGRNSLTREWMGIKAFKKDYNQSAIVCLMHHDKPHQGMALEHFRTQGPFAVLPFTENRSAVVWTVPRHEADQWVTCDETVFNAALQTRCGDLYGAVAVEGARSAWPLTLVKAQSYCADRMVLVAEAAHGMHPIAGQGLNMSFRDLAALTEILEGAVDPGAASLLKRYQSMRRMDNIGMVAATDILNELFGYNFFGIRAARRLGLHAVSRLPFVKKFFMKQAMGAVGHLPTLIKQAG